MTEEQQKMLDELRDVVPELSSDDVKKIESLKQKIEYVGIDSIHLSPNKARKVKEGIPKVANSIRTLGFRSPIYVDGNNNDEVVGGHTRLMAAKLLGLTKVPIVRVTDLTPELIRLLRLADNKVAEFSGWDFAELDAELAALKLDLPELDFGELGFTDTKDGAGLDDFFEEGESDKKDKEPKKIQCTCPECGHTFEQEV